MATWVATAIRRFGLHTSTGWQPKGTKFTQFYSASPACTASRYALLTGRLPVRSGFGWVLMPNARKGLKATEYTLAEGLKSAGYSTACIGKWHLGNKRQFLPLQHGFDEYFGLPYSNDMRPPKWGPLPLIEGNETIEENPDQTQLTRRYTERAVDFIARNKQHPFFCYLAYAMPHVPLSPGKDYQGQSLRGTYGDVMEEIDDSVGSILDTLREHGIDHNTLVVLTSDNGPWIIKDQKGGSAGLLRDGKGSTWEGGVREPCIAWWPGTVPAGQSCTQWATTMDLLPTLCRLAGATDGLPETDGVDIGNLLRGKPLEASHPPLFYYGAGMKLYAVRDGAWKLHVRQYSQTKQEYFGGRVPLLFNLATDPSEKYDLSTEHPEIVERPKRPN